MSGSSLYGQNTVQFVLRNGHSRQFNVANAAQVKGAIDAYEEFLGQ